MVPADIASCGTIARISFLKAFRRGGMKRDSDAAQLDDLLGNAESAIPPIDPPPVSPLA